MKQRPPHSTIALVVLMLPVVAMILGARASAKGASAVPPPANLQVGDAPWDGGDKIRLRWDLPTEERKSEAEEMAHYKILRAGEQSGPFFEIGQATPKREDYWRGKMSFLAEKCERGEEYYFRVLAVRKDGEQSEAIQVGPATAARQPFDGGRLSLAFFTFLLGAAVIYWIGLARRGKPLKVRKIAGLEAMDEAVGRATEMGRSCMFIPGIQDMNDMQTIAGLTVLSHIAQTAAEYGARIEVPTCRSLVMTAARETVQSAFLTAGRPDAYREDDIYYVTDEQFGYVAYLTGAMVRDKPAACFFMGAFFAEALIIAETGNSIGAIQVAGTAMPAQLPFFVAACDYTLIGEEFFAASAYLSGDPEQLGSLKGQDMGKLVAGALLIAGCLLATLAAVTGSPAVNEAVGFLRDTLLP